LSIFIQGMSPIVLERFLPPDITAIDAVALAWFVTAWAAFNFIQDHLLKHSVNQHLIVLRRHWMARMLERDARMPDTVLLGHSMQSCSFFASTTMLVLAGLVGFFGVADHAHQLLDNMGLAVKTSLALFEVKLMIQGAIFVLAFFKFTWAIRQFNYCVAMIGSAPLPPVPEAERDRLAGPIAGMLSLALGEFNSGIRAYYFALAGMVWLVDPFFYMVATAGVVVILTRRQVFSRAERLLRSQLEYLELED
jgi:uncharacterized membrane protein